MHERRYIFGLFCSFDYFHVLVGIMRDLFMIKIWFIHAWIPTAGAGRGDSFCQRGVKGEKWGISR